MTTREAPSAFLVPAFTRLLLEALKTSD